LYHNEKDIERLDEDLLRKQAEVQKLEKKKEKAEEVLKEKKKESGKVSRELAKIEQEIREHVSHRYLNISFQYRFSFVYYCVGSRNKSEETNVYQSQRTRGACQEKARERSQVAVSSSESP